MLISTLFLGWFLILNVMSSGPKITKLIELKKGFSAFFSKDLILLFSNSIIYFSYYSSGVTQVAITYPYL